MKRNRKIYLIIPIIVVYIIFCLTLELIAIKSCIEIFNTAKISSDSIEQVIYENSDDIIQILTDKKLEKANIALDYDDVHVEILEEGNLEASAYGWNIFYEFDNGKLNKASVKRNFLCEHPEICIILVIIFLIVFTLILIDMISKNRKLENENLKEKNKNT